jgi:hypothetical protein
MPVAFYEKAAIHVFEWRLFRLRYCWSIHDERPEIAWIYHHDFGFRAKCFPLIF